MSQQITCPLITMFQNNFCSMCPFLDNIGCKTVQDYFSKVKQALYIHRLTSGARKTFLETMTMFMVQGIRRNSKRWRSFSENDVVNLCSRAEDLAVIKSLKSYFDTKRIEDVRSLFSYLCQKYLPYIRSISQKRLPKHPLCTHDEITQRVMIKLIDKDFGALRSFEGRSSFRTFLTTIIFRTISDCLSEYNDQPYPLDDINKERWESRHYILEKTTFEKNESQKILSETVAHVLLEMADHNLEDAQILVLKFRGRSNREIGRLLGVKENTVSKRVTRRRGILERFSQLLEGHLRRDHGLTLKDFEPGEVLDENFIGETLSHVGKNL